jgi:anti-sigma-K factor RskA
MIDELLQDDAGLYVMRMLPPDEAAAFEKRLALDAELRALVNQLEDATGHLAYAAPTIAPPPGLKQRILSDIRHEVRVVPMSAGRRFAWVPWALAAGLAIAAIMGWQRAGSYREQSLAYREENRTQERLIAELRSRDALSTMQIATLNTKVAAYEKALAVVIFDAQRQSGTVKLAGFPKAPPNKDFQLWAIPSSGKPISAGVVPVGADGISQVSFKPAQEVREIPTFAISVEPAGGSPQPSPEVIFVGK